jgi:integrase
VENPSGKNRNRRTLTGRAVDKFEEKTLARRRHQDGMLLKLKNGFAMRFYENCDGERRRIQKWLGDLTELPTRAAARTVMQAELAVINKHVTINPTITSTTFRIAAREWLRDCQSRKQRPVKPSVLHNWDCILRNHLNPLVGELPLSDVGNRTLRSVVEDLSAKKLSPATIRNVTLVLKLVVSSVVDQDGNVVHVRKWNRRFVDAPAVNPHEQHRPSFTAEQVTRIVGAASGRLQMAAILFGATGLRAGELLGLECKHFDGSSVKVEQAIWAGNGTVVAPKTQSSRRVVDLHPSVADLLKAFIAGRTSGYIFQTTSRKPVTQTNLLRRELHPLLESLGIPICGFHSFRRYRNSFLRQSHCPHGLVTFWMGHADKSMSDLYDRSSQDLQYRKDVCRAMGLGFDLPKTLTPKQKKTSNSGLNGRFAETMETEAIPC